MTPVVLLSRWVVVLLTSKEPDLPLDHLNDGGRVLEVETLLVKCVAITATWVSIMQRSS